MLKDHSQLQLSLSPYQGLYDAIIPADHLLRRIKENIDFSFVNPMLRKQYCENFGRPAKEPEMMFKLLFLKKLYDLSDEPIFKSKRTKHLNIRLKNTRSTLKCSSSKVRRTCLPTKVYPLPSSNRNLSRLSMIRVSNSFSE